MNKERTINNPSESLAAAGSSTTISSSSTSDPSKLIDRRSKIQNQNLKYTGTRHLNSNGDDDGGGDAVPQLTRSSFGSPMQAQRDLFQNSNESILLLKRSDDPVRNLIPTSKTTTTAKRKTTTTNYPKTISSVITKVFVNPLLSILSIPYTHGIKPVGHFVFHPFGYTSKSTPNTKDTSDKKSNTEENDPPKEDIKNNHVTFQDEEEKDNKKNNNKKNNTTRPRLLMSTSQKYRKNQTNGRILNIGTKLQSLRQGTDMPHRIFRWVCILVLLAQPLLFVMGIIPMLILYILFSDIIDFILHKNKKSRRSRVSKAYTDIISQGFADIFDTDPTVTDEENEEARKKYVYAAGMANAILKK